MNVIDRASLDFLFFQFAAPPVFVEGNSLNSSITLTEGIPSTLQCVVNSRPASAIIWQYDAAINASNASTTAVNGYLTTVKGTLVIHNPTLSMDGKQVQCLASHRYSASINRTTMLSVDCKFTLHDFSVHQPSKLGRL